MSEHASSYGVRKHRFDEDGMRSSIYSCAIAMVRALVHDENYVR